MERTLSVLCLILMMTVVATVCAEEMANAAEAPAPTQLAAIVDYPAIRLWFAKNDGATVGCLLNLAARYNPRLGERTALLLVDALLTASVNYDLDPFFIASVIAAESSFVPRARSRCGAEGLMQLTPPVQPWLGVNDAFDIRQNIMGGCRYLSYLKERFGRPELVLAAYNAGPTRVSRLGRVPRIAETVVYIGRVMRLRARLAGEAAAPLALHDPFVSA